MVWMPGAALTGGAHTGRHTTRRKVEYIESMTAYSPHRSRVVRMSPWPTEHQEDSGYAAVACVRTRVIDLGRVRKLHIDRGDYVDMIHTQT